MAHHLITIDRVFQRRLSAADGTVAVLDHPAASPRSLTVATSASTGGPPRRSHSESGGDVDMGKLMDVVAWVKRLGNDNFTQHVNLKKQQLSDHLRTAKGCSRTDNFSRTIVILTLNKRVAVSVNIAAHIL